MTCHSGTMAGFFEAVGHHQFEIGTGVFVPLLVSVFLGIGTLTARSLVALGVELMVDPGY